MTTASRAADPPVRTIAANMAAQFGSQLLNTVLATVVSIAVIRHLGRAEYGVMAFVVSYLSYFLILSSLGVDIVLMRAIARAPESAPTLLRQALGLRLLLSVATVLVCWAVVPFVATERRVVHLVMLYSATVLFSAQGIYHVAFQAQFRGPILNGRIAVWSLAFTALRLGLVLVDADVRHFLAADVASAAIVFLISRHLARRHLGLEPRPTVDWYAWRGLLAEGLPLALASWLIALHARVDQTVLFRLKGPESLGGYAAVVRLSEVWILFANVFILSLFPLLARHSAVSADRLAQTTALAYRYLYVVIAPISIGLALYASEILRLVFGAAFTDAAVPLRLLAAAEVFAFANAATYNVLFSTGRQREACLISGAALALNVGLNVFLIPPWGATGAAAASLVSYASVPTVAALLRATRDVGVRSFRELPRPAVAALLAGAGCSALELGPMPGAATLLGVYPLALLASGAVGRRDLDLLRRAVRGG